MIKVLTIRQLMTVSFEQVAQGFSATDEGKFRNLTSGMLKLVLLYKLYFPSESTVNKLCLYLLAQLRMSYCDHFLSIRPLTFSNDFSSEAAEPILLKFHMEPP